MTIFRLLNAQGIAGLAASLGFALLLVVQKAETRHWKEQSGQFEQFYRNEQAAFATTIADYRAAAETARAADRANAARVAAEQRAINERTSNDYQARLADARARAERLRLTAAAAAADRGDSRDAEMPGLPAAAGRSAQAAREDRLPAADALIATEQAIQLDELIRWVRRQHAVAVSADENMESAGAAR